MTSSGGDDDNIIRRGSLRLVHTSADAQQAVASPSGKKTRGASDRSSSSMPPQATEVPLPNTLAVRMQQWRERRMLSQAVLAQRVLVPVRMIEDIESGIELFLSPAIRQRLARVLQIHPRQIQELEITPPPSSNSTLQAAGGSLYQAILDNPDAPQKCPNCNSPLNIRLFTRRDMQNQPLTVVKANCIQCLFRLTDD